MEGTIRVAAGSILVGIAVLGIKFLAWWVTGSVALYSDALESLVNVATAITALLAVRLSAQPADANHPYGHHKVEYFSAVLAGSLIIVAAIMILREAWGAVQTPRMLDAPMAGLVLAGVASVANAVWSFVLIREGRRSRSPALVADGRHLLSDVVTILWSGWRVVRESLGGLMDEAVPVQQLDQIRTAISQHAVGAIEAHDLRTRRAGRITFIDFHLVVPAMMTVTEAHEICDRIEGALRAAVDDALITIHVEPEHKAKHSGVVVL